MQKKLIYVLAFSLSTLSMQMYPKGILPYLLLPQLFTFISKLDQELLNAAKEGNVKKMRQCIHKGAHADWHPFSHDPKFNFDTMLTSAVKSNNIYAVQVLLQNGAAASINWIIRGGNTALGLAVYQENVPMVRTLLLHGAKIQGDSRMNDVLLDAIKTENLSIITLLIKHGAFIRDIHIDAATFLGNDTILSFLQEEKNRIQCARPRLK